MCQYGGRNSSEPFFLLCCNRDRLDGLLSWHTKHCDSLPLFGQRRISPLCAFSLIFFPFANFSSFQQKYRISFLPEDSVRVFSSSFPTRKILSRPSPPARRKSTSPLFLHSLLSAVAVEFFLASRVWRCRPCLSPPP